MVNSERNLTLLQAVDPARRAGPAGLAADLPGRRAAWVSVTHFDFASSEEVFDEIRRFSNPQTGYDLRGASYARLAARHPLQWPCPPDDDSDRHPIRYLNDGVSQDLFVDADGHRPRLAFPRRRGGRCSTPARTWIRTSCPTTTTRWCSTPAGCSTSGTP